ncbi:DUF3850 domain-containing protein [Aeromonas hydrophila]|uniref:ASCH/PUA domain-containing protein n=1 Tax=Aeromonas hydrophila TaxID=644 RepID=UPI001C76A53F|nr:ASCH/PUA domain-containing protein [Aeromonas hydrophila]QWL69361.1 DUF3850 domain-containing protein [Aeromonas hydrophila]
MKHELKIKPDYLAAIYFGEKTFEIRNNFDRNFQVGDTLLLRGWDGEFTGDFVEKVVSYITDFEQQPGYVVLGLVNHQEHELLEKFHRTGVAIERAISTGSVPADHPLKSRLELLANHYKREQALADGMVAMADRCNLLTDLLLEVTMVVPAIGVAIDDLPVVDAFLERIEAALAGTSPKRPDNEWTDATQTSTEQDYRELQAQHDQVQGRMKAALDALREAKHCVYLAEKNAMNMNSRDKHAVLGARIDALLAGQVPAPDVTATETIRTAPEHIWLQVGDQTHYHSEPFPSDTSEVSWCADSVMACEVPYVRADLAAPAVLQGGESCDFASPSSSPD